MRSENHDMKTFAVLGHPIKHSLSPKIFKFLREYYSKKDLELDFKYEILDIEPKDFLKSIHLLKKYDGLNITSPYKEKILEFTYKKTPQVEMLRAANVLKKLSNGKFEAHNTDVYGFKKSLNGFEIEKMSALVLGSSGAARAAMLGLYEMGVKDIYVKARNFKSLESLDIPVKPYTVQKPQLVIQATTIGMANAPYDLKDLDFFNIDYSNTQISYDLIYSPKETPFMKLSKESKVPYIMGGETMLGLQAIKTFGIWFDLTMFDLATADASILKELKEIL